MSNSRKRWLLLGQLLRDEKPQVEQSDVSVRRFKSFGLLRSIAERDIEPSTGPDGDKTNDKPRELSPSNNQNVPSSKPGELPPSNNHSATSKWHIYYFDELNALSLYVRTVDEPMTRNDLLGFNNTGNVCVWPSEEILAYYCVKNQAQFENQLICEIGGGMTCLAGIALASSCNIKEMLLTDGNYKSVKNVNEMVKKNQHKFGQAQVMAKVLRWDSHDSLGALKQRYDKIICADCYFFKDCHEDLIKTLYNLLKPQGEVISFAPTRGDSLHVFADYAAMRGFQVTITQDYDAKVTKLHHHYQSLGLERYDDNLHYPIMVHLLKKSS